jgi:hypothetical protein
MTVALILFIAGVIGGVVNAIAGGATLITFPVMLMVGLPPVLANATNAVAIFPGHWVAAFADKEKLPKLDRGFVCSLGICFATAMCGALLLLAIPGDLFMLPVPALIGFATALFTFAPRLANRSIRQDKVPGSWMALPVVAFYGGFFGAGLGILLSAILSFSEPDDIRKVKVAKNLIAGSVSLAAVIVFVFQGAVLWEAAIPMLFGALVGGYAGGHLTRVVPGSSVRLIVIVTGSFMTGFYAWSYWF